jgi:hypothetical protein
LPKSRKKELKQAKIGTFYLDVFDGEGKFIESSEPGYSLMVKERVVE